MKSAEIFHHPMWTCKTVVMQLSPKFMFTEFRASFLHTALGWRHAIYSKKCPTVPETLRVWALISHFTWAPVRWCRWIWACPSINISLTFTHPLSSLAPSCLSFSQVSCVVRWGEEPISWGVLIHPSPLTYREQIDRSWELFVTACASDTVQTGWSVSIFASIFTLTSSGFDCTLGSCFILLD